MSSASIIKAVIARFDGAQGAGSAYAAVGGRLWYGLAPEDETTPYITFWVVSQTRQRTFADDLPTWRVQFNVYDEDREPNDCTDAADKLAARFNRAALTYAGGDYTDAGCLLENTIGPIREDQFWRITMDFLVTAQST